MKIVDFVKSIFCITCVIFFLSNNCQALEEAQNETAKNDVPAINKTKEKKYSKIEKQKQKSENTSSNNSSTTNEKLLTPNISPGIIPGGDIERTRQYYQNLKGRNETSPKELKDSPQDDLSNIKLPARVVAEAPSIYIKQVSITESKIFSDVELNYFKKLAEEKELTSEDINNLIDLINLQYQKRNIITAQAFLPVQNLEGGVLKIELVEAKIASINIEGNKYNRKWFLKSQYSQKEGEILDLRTLESDLEKFNRNAKGSRLSAKLKPGEKYGTTDVTLSAEEQFPYHLSASYDSFGRDTTGLLRSGILLNTDSLFGFQDRLTAAVNMARSSVSPYFDYNIPINLEGTRLGVSYIYGKNDISSGQYRDFDITSKTNVFSAYITHPLKTTERLTLNLNTSTNMKFSSSAISDYVYSKYDDYNIAVGLGGQYRFKKSMLYSSLYSTNGIVGDLMSSNRNYFTKLNADSYYIHYLPKDIIATVRAGGQYSPSNVSYIEQYQIGGISSVRGYTESLLMAASSYFTSVEVLLPIIFLPKEINVPFNKKGAKFALRDSIKLAVFADGGAIHPYEEQTKNLNFLASVGAGLRVAISKYLTARVYVGVPLMNRDIYQESPARVHFDLIASPF